MASAALHHPRVDVLVDERAHRDVAQAVERQGPWTSSWGPVTSVHLVHPSGLHWGNRRVRNDERDATEIAHRLRRHDLPEAWIAPPKTRELRELVRYRAKLLALRSGLKVQVHAVLAKQGIIPKLDDVFGPKGQVFLDQVPLDHAYAERVESLRDPIELYDREVDMLEREIYSWLRDDAGYWAIQATPGWVAPWPPSSWPRSATSPGSPAPVSCARGRG